MRKDDYIQLLTNNEIIQMELKPNGSALLALLENNLRLAGMATKDEDLGEEKDKMSSFCIHKSLEFLENKGFKSEEANETLEYLVMNITIQKKLFG